MRETLRNKHRLELGASMGVFHESGILMVVTGPEKLLMTLTAPGHRQGFHIGSASIRGY